MEIARVLSGYSLGGADLLRRAMGKKIRSEMEAQRKNFIEGAVESGVHKGTAADIFVQVEKFAGYGFNKSHAAAYALVAYQTAYLKANYPVEFLAASMTLDAGNTDKLGQFRVELERQKIELLPPNIQKSNVYFSVENTKEGEPAVRYALGALRNVGASAMDVLVREREKNGPFKWYHENGQLMIEVTFKDGERDGPYKEYYYFGGQLRLEGTYKDDKLDGPYKYYYPYGELKEEGTHKDGEKNGPFKSYQENGQLRQEGTYKDGQRDGTFTIYYDNGQLLLEVTFKDCLLYTSPSPRDQRGSRMAW